MDVERINLDSNENIKKAIIELESIITKDETYQNSVLRDIVFKLHYLQDFFRNEFKDHFVSGTYIDYTEEYEWIFKNVNSVNFLEFESKHVSTMHIRKYSYDDYSKIKLNYRVSKDKIQLVRQELVEFIKSKIMKKV